MAAADQSRIYYCTQCRIETAFAKVCPKCHRKGTLQNRSDSGPAPAPRRRSSAALPAVVGGRSRTWWFAGAGAALVVIALGGWLLSKPTSNPAKTKSQRKQPPREAPARVFGAPPKGVRTAPPPAPRLCGLGYRISVAVRDSAGPRPKTPRPPKSKAAKPAKPGKQAPRRTPELLEQRHVFLIARGLTGRLSYVPLELEVKITQNGKTGTGLYLGRKGGLLPDQRTRRLRRLGFHDNLQPGLRISDLIGRAQADLAANPRGGLVVRRQRLQNRLVTGWVRTGVDLATFLHPQPPKKDASVFTDSRVPPEGFLPGATTLVRRFRRQAPPKSAVTSPRTVTYLVDSPRGAMRTAKSTNPVAGEVTLRPSEPLPSKAVLTIDNVRQKAGTAKITIRLEATGKRCSDK